MCIQILDQVAAEIEEKKKQEALLREQRHFETTNNTFHKPMDYKQNEIGLRVIKT